jgi:protein phosphatase
MTHLESWDGDFHLFAVCDGLGGHAAGDKASRFIAEALHGALEAPCLDADDLRQRLFGIQKQMAASPDEDSGSTVAGIVIYNKRLFVFNAGDSRVYRITKSRAQVVSHDHSFVQRLVDEKFLSEQEAFVNPYKNLVDFGLGAIFADRWENGTKVFVAEMTARKNSVFLLCSDGVNDVLHDNQICQALLPDPVSQAPALLREVNKAGIRDNTSFIVIRLAP